jgi:beta-xylosidase
MKFASKARPRITFRLATICLATLTIAASARGESPATQPATYTNPLNVQVADPFIFREGNTYYLYGTAAGDGLLVWTSADLVNWTERGHAFARTDDTWSRRDFWAPELFKHHDKYYLHFTANHGQRRAAAHSRVAGRGWR